MNTVIYLARRDVEGTGTKIYFLPLVNKRQNKDNARAFWRTNSPQTKNYYPLIVRHRLWTKKKKSELFFLTEWTCSVNK